MSKNYNNIQKLDNITGSIDDNNDVSFSGMSDGKFLQYSSSSGSWLPSSSGNFTLLSVNGLEVSTSGHSHNTADIVNFNSGVSGLLPVTNIIAGSGIDIGNTSGIFTVNSIPNIVGTGVNNYIAKWNSNSTLSTGSLYDDGSYRIGINTNSPICVLDIQAATGSGNGGPSLRLGNINNSLDSSMRLETDGGYLQFIQDAFNPTFSYSYSSISSVLYTPSGSGVFDIGTVFAHDLAFSTNSDTAMTIKGNNRYIGIGTSNPLYHLHLMGTGNFTQNVLVNGTGVSISGHQHVSSDITNFNSTVSGLLPTIANSGNNRVLLSTGSPYGISATNYTFPTSDGTSGQTLVTNGSGAINWSNINNISRGSFNLSQSSGTFTVNNGYVIGSLDVYYNGVKLLSGTDYTATNGSTFTLTNSAVSGDVVEYFGTNTISSINANTTTASVTASAGQTVFNVAGGYTVGSLDVFLNGSKLVNGVGYTATNGTSIVLTSPASAGNILQYTAYGVVVASNGLQKTGDTMAGNLTIGSGINIQFTDSIIDTNTLDVGLANGRLTLESNVAVSTTNQTAKTILYYTPYNGDRICLYDTTINKWKMYSFSELSLSLSGLAANTNFDIFIYDNNGTLTLESTAWASATARATNLTLVDGVYARTGSLNRRYLGTIRTTGTTGQCEDSTTKRFVWNVNNKEERLVRRYITVSWTYASAAWRVFNGQTAATYSIDVVNGLGVDTIQLKAGVLYTIAVTTSTIYYIGIAEDATVNVITADTTNFGADRIQSTFTTQKQLVAFLEHIVPLGYHYYYPIEYREIGGTPTLFGSNTVYWGGLLGTWRC